METLERVISIASNPSSMPVVSHSSLQNIWKRR